MYNNNNDTERNPDNILTPLVRRLIFKLANVEIRLVYNTGTNWPKNME